MNEKEVLKAIGDGLSAGTIHLPVSRVEMLNVPVNYASISRPAEGLTLQTPDGEFDILVVRKQIESTAARPG